MSYLNPHFRGKPGQSHPNAAPPPDNRPSFGVYPPSSRHVPYQQQQQPQQQQHQQPQVYAQTRRPVVHQQHALVRQPMPQAQQHYTNTQPWNQQRSVQSSSSTNNTSSSSLTAATHKELKELMTKVSMLTTQLEAKNTAILKMQGELNKERNIAADVNQKYASLSKESSEMRVLLRTLGDSVTNYCTKNEEMAKEVTEARDATDGYKLLIASTSEKNTFVTKRNEILLAKCEKLAAEVASNGGVTKADVAFVEGRLTTLQGDLTAATNDAAQKSRIAHELEAKLTTANDHLSSNMNKVKQLERQLTIERQQRAVKPTSSTSESSVLSSDFVAALLASNAGRQNSSEGEKALRTDLTTLKDETRSVFAHYCAKMEAASTSLESMASTLGMMVDNSDDKEIINKAITESRKECAKRARAESPDVTIVETVVKNKKGRTESPIRDSGAVSLPPPSSMLRIGQEARGDFFFVGGVGPQPPAAPTFVPPAGFFNNRTPQFLPQGPTMLHPGPSIISREDILHEQLARNAAQIERLRMMASMNRF